jgi:hemolysin III
VAPLLVTLLAIAPAGTRRAGIVVYAAGLCSMLLASTTYHRRVDTLRWRAIWRRADHAMIFVAIAGTSTPLCLKVLSPMPGTFTLIVVWGAAAVGAAITQCHWQRIGHLATGMYITNGCAGVMLAPTLAVNGFVLPTALLIAGGVVYTVGAICFACDWPMLNPSVFSYHEVWHVSSMTGAAMHLAAVWLVIG